MQYRIYFDDCESYSHGKKVYRCFLKAIYDCKEDAEKDINNLKFVSLDYVRFGIMDDNEVTVHEVMDF